MTWRDAQQQRQTPIPHVIRRSTSLRFTRWWRSAPSHVDDHDRSKDIGKHHVGLLDPLAHRPIQRRHEGRHIEPEYILGHGGAGCRGHEPAGQRDGKHKTVEEKMPQARTHALPWLELGRQLRHRIEPPPQQTKDENGEQVIAKRGVPGVIGEPLGSRREMGHPPAMDEQQQDHHCTDPVQQLGGPAPLRA